MIRTWKNRTPRVHPEAYVNEIAYVVGDVEVGAGSTVWPFAVLRGDDGAIIVGEDTHVQDGSIVHSNPGETTHIGSHNNIGHSVVIHARRIGDSCLIGNNSTLLEGVEIGDHCIVGANALVLVGTKAPPYSFLAGVPAQVAPLSEKQRTMLEEGMVEGFQESARQYKADGL